MAAREQKTAAVFVSRDVRVQHECAGAGKHAESDLSIVVGDAFVRGMKEGG